MAFDQATRNRLAGFVSDARNLLTDEFTRQLQNEYGLDPDSGEVTPLARLTALDDARRETAGVLRDTLDYYLSGNPKPDSKAYREVMDRIVREQSFTVLNRLSALRMSEARGVVLESIAKGYQSKGFQLYARLAGSALGETGEAYRAYLFSLMDEFAVDLPVLFDRFSPQARLFPRETALLKLLKMINNPEIDPLWTEDETIGWIYQYFNTKEERKAMRDASQAPRNSRELAVRNQFFTPRYVVEFLTDNTLGRIWYEMTQGETALKDTCHYLVRRPTEIFLNEGEAVPEQPETGENLLQEELLHQPVYIPHRPLKDPREIKMLDPACGSMHFGLYAFDIFELIYAEAWDLEENLGENAFQRLADMSPLHKTYSDKDAYLRDVPRLIIERNIHGVDIDPRAVQIAGLSLWLRAQKSWQAQDIKPSERPQIRRLNVVCAEPMPGDRDMLEEFLGTLQGERLEALMRTAWQVPAHRRVRATAQMADALASLVRKVWDEMELAGEAGSLLKIEETLRAAIETARQAAVERSPLFRVLEFGMDEAPREDLLQLVSGTEQSFFERAEELVLAALQEYARQAENGAGYRRRLFAGDAAQGFAFIDLFRKRYDIAVMNPPFGESSKEAKNYLDIVYPFTKNDLYAIFTERCLGILNSNGRLGTITSRTGLFISSFQNWREEILLKKAPPEIAADLGNGVLDAAMVETITYVLAKSQSLTNIQSVFIRLLYDEQKDISLVSAIQSINFGESLSNIFITNPESFRLVPGSPFAYWTDNSIKKLFTDFDSLESEDRSVRLGLSTKNDARFVRGQWEIRPNLIGRQAKWARYANGSSTSPYFWDYVTLVLSENDFQQLREYIAFKFPYLNGNTGWILHDENDYLSPFIGWPLRSQRYSPQAVPLGYIFSARTYALLLSNSNDYLYSLAVLSSTLVHYLLSLRLGVSGQPEYVTGTVRVLPFPNISSHDRQQLADIALSLYSVQQRKFAQLETSNLFSYPRFLDGKGKTLLSLISQWNLDSATNNHKMICGQKDIDAIVYNLYGISTNEQKNIEIFGNLIVEDTDEEGKHNSCTLQGFVSELISYAIGTGMGRWDIRYTIGEKITPSLPAPFAPLPACPPGLLQNTQGLPAVRQDVSADYPLRISWTGILTDDESHPEDIEARVREALIVIWRDHAEAIEQEASQILGVHTLREYFHKPTLFFADHLKRYSKSRRYAPIYWPLSTPSCSYTLWLYYHRLNDQTLYTCVNDFVDPKLKQISEESARLRMKKGRSTADEKELERLTDFERELRDFREELLRVAKFWKPNLNDGVEITAAPLWKLFQHKPWQKRLKETWGKLEAGEYDWAHLAYSIWPDRVREKCKTDKSLAIAHDLESLYIEPKAPLKKKKAKIIEEIEEFSFNGED